MMELGDYIQYAAALIFVLGLIGLAGFFAKWLGVNGNNGFSGTGASKRLRVVERHSLDAKRCLILVRRDDVEHLILVGATSETLVESGIEAPTENPETSEMSLLKPQMPRKQNMPAPLRDAAQKVVHMFTRESSQ